MMAQWRPPTRVAKTVAPGPPGVRSSLLRSAAGSMSAPRFLTSTEPTPRGRRAADTALARSAVRATTSKRLSSGLAAMSSAVR